MKHFLFFILSVSFALGTFAQELKIKSCTLASTDVTASSLENIRMDDVGDPCALVKILLLDGISKVQGNVIGDIKEYSSEKWVYLSKGTKEIRIIPMHYKPLRVYFPDFGIDGVESKRTYVLDLVIQNMGAEPVDAGGNFYALSVQPKNAVVTIDGVLQPSSSDGEYSAMLPYGTHTYKVEAGGYISKSGSFVVSSGDMTPVSVSLLSAMASVSITCPTPAVSLYVDKKAVGNSPWSGSLKEGMHLVEVRKSGYRSQQKTIQLAQQQKLDVTFGELVAIQGNLSVNYKPFGADVYVDGKKLGQSPRVFNGLLVGNHLVEVRKDGYATDRKTVTISEGQTASITGTLASNAVASASSNTSGYLSNSSSVASGCNTISIPVKNLEI